GSPALNPPSIVFLAITTGERDPSSLSQYPSQVRTAAARFLNANNGRLCTTTGTRASTSGLATERRRHRWPPTLLLLLPRTVPALTPRHGERRRGLDIERFNAHWARLYSIIPLHSEATLVR
ncbi:hypothetical protein AB1N83_014158, partial [Pleurotus pulmonarius]